MVPPITATNMPPNTAVPSERRLAAPAPVAITSGSVPSRNEIAVISTARKRSLAAASAASYSGVHSSYLFLANSTIRIAVLQAMPKSSTKPTCV